MGLWVHCMCNYEYVTKDTKHIETNKLLFKCIYFIICCLCVYDTCLATLKHTLIISGYDINKMDMHCIR